MKHSILALLFFIHTSLFAFGEDVLPVEKAFVPAISSQEGIIHANIALAPEIYVYDEQLKFELTSPKKLDLTPLLTLPKPVEFHEFIVHRDDILVDIPLTLIQKEIGDVPFTLQVSYQGCSEKGLCYQPMKPTYHFDAQGTLLQERVKAVSHTKSAWGATATTDATPQKEMSAVEKSIHAVNTSKAETTNITLSEEDSIADKLQNSSLLQILALFFGFGLLLAFTPCIFPMIPILSSIITLEAKQSGGLSVKKGLFLSAIYVISSALVYAIVGMLSAVFGANIFAAMQNPWVIVIFAAIFIALAFSMFGYYEIQLPRSWQNFANKTSDNSKGNGLFGVAVMGALSALIVGPCVAPPLAGALLFIGQTGDIALGGIALFVLGLGMGAPLLLIGAGGGKFMPKPGGWMTRVSYVFGVVMLGIAIWFLARILPASISMLLWALLFIGSGVYSGAFEPFKDGISGISKLLKVLAVALLAYGLVLFTGIFTGGSNPLDPLHKLYTGKQSVTGVRAAQFTPLSTLTQLEEVTLHNEKPIMIDFSADWCASCKEFEEITFEDETVKGLLAQFSLYRIDVTKNSDEDKALQKKFGVVGPPAIIFYDTNHQELVNQKIVGYKDPKTFIPLLNNVLGN